jgi:hypothetical protein
MSSGRWLRELSPHQAIRNACCFTRSASITSHTKRMLLYPLGEHHLTYASSVDTVFLERPHSSPPPVPPPSPPPPSPPPPSPFPPPPPLQPHRIPHRRCPCRHRHSRCLNRLNRRARHPRPRHRRHLPRRKPLFGAIEGASCCCCFCAARLRRCVGGANCNARSPGTSLRSVNSLRR